MIAAEQQPVTATEQSTAQHRRRAGGRPWQPGQSGNPTGIRISKHAIALFNEIAGELGGEAALSAIDRTLLLQAARLLVRSARLKDHDAAIRMSSEARRTLEGLRRRATRASAPAAEPFTEIAAKAQAAEAARRAAELAGDTSEADAEVTSAGDETPITDHVQLDASDSDAAISTRRKAVQP